MRTSTPPVIKQIRPFWGVFRFCIPSKPSYEQVTVWSDEWLDRQSPRLFALGDSKAPWTLVIDLKTASNTQCKEVLAVSPVVVDEVIDRAAVMQSCKQFKPILVRSGNRELYEEKVQPLASFATYTTLQRANFAGV